MKKLISVLVFAVLSFSASALSLEDFSLSIEPFFGFKQGNLGEYLYAKDSLVSSDLKSYLEWDVDKVFVLGSKISGSWRNINVDVSFAFAPSQNSGLMQDSDWYNIELISDSTYQYKTHFTRSDNNVDKACYFETSSGYTFDINRFFSITPSIGFDYYYIYFMAKGLAGRYGTKNISGGYYYPYNSSNSEIKYYSEDTNVMSYQRYTQVFWLGTTFTFLLPFNFKTDIGFLVSPYINTTSYDHHILTGGYYADSCSAYFSAAKVTASLSYTPIDRLSLILTGSYFYEKEIRGNTYESYDSGSSYKVLSNYAGGVSQKEFTLSASVRYTIF